MKQEILAGTTSKLITVFIQASTSTTGAGLTGLNASSSGLIWYWFAEDSTASAQVTLASGNLGTWTSGSIKEVDSTNLPGFYELGIPNTVIASTNSRSWVTMMLSGATSMVPLPVELQLVAYNPMDGVTLGLTDVKSNVLQWNSTNVATPNIGGVPKVDVVDWLGTAVTSSAGVPIVDVAAGTITTVTGTVTATVPGLVSANVTQWLGTAVTSNAGVPLVDVAAGTVTTVTGNVNGTVAAVTTCTGVGTATVVTSATVVGGTIATVTGTVTATVPTQVTANVTDWLGTAVTSSAGVPVTTNLGTVTATVPTAVTVTGTPAVNVTQWLGTAVTSNAGVPLVDVNSITGTVTATVVGGTIATVTNPVTLSTGQLTVIRNTALSGFTFPMYNAATGVLQTGLTVGAVNSIDGGVIRSCTHAVSEVGSGLYSLDLSAADVNGTVITFIFTATNAASAVITVITQA